MKVRAMPGVAVLDYAYAKAHGRYRLAARKLRVVTLRELQDAAKAGADRYVGATGELALPDAIKGDVVVRQRRPVDLEDEYYVEAWVAYPDPVDVPAMGEAGAYFRARVREGGLAAADADTAALCGVAAPRSASKKGGTQ